MRDFISLRKVLKEINKTTLKDFKTTSFHSHSKTFTLPQSTVYEDNQACLKFAAIPKILPRTKHIAFLFHFFRNKVKELEIQVIVIGTDNQLANQFTKGPPVEKFVTFRKHLMGW